MIRTYSRFPYRPSYTYLFFTIVMVLMCWEGQRADAAIASGRYPEGFYTFAHSCQFR